MDPRPPDPKFYLHTGLYFPTFFISWFTKKMAIFVYDTGKKTKGCFFLPRVLFLVTPRAESIHISVIPVTEAAASVEKPLNELGRPVRTGAGGLVWGLGV